ncbi:MAG: hypothetical protein EOP11_21360 [Proteobacteria bacterium]|nr:MAG: hypothetical protein EOP11_21360 [Pseudomonadota bacterium]
MIFRSSIFAFLVLSSSAFAGNFEGEESLALAMAQTNYSAELKDSMRVDYPSTTVHTLRDRKGADIGYWVGVTVQGFENGGATKRMYRVESANEAGVITSVKLLKVEGPVGP